MSNQRGFEYQEPPAISARREARRAQGVLDRAGMNPSTYVPGYGVPAAAGRNYGLTPSSQWGATFVSARRDPTLSSAALNPAIGTPAATIPSGVPAAAPTPAAPTPAVPPNPTEAANIAWHNMFGGARAGLQSISPALINARNTPQEYGAISASTPESIDSVYGTATRLPHLQTTAFDPRSESDATTIPGGSAATPYITPGTTPEEIEARRSANEDRVRRMLLSARS